MMEITTKNTSLVELLIKSDINYYQHAILYLWHKNEKEKHVIECFIFLM